MRKGFIGLFLSCCLFFNSCAYAQKSKEVVEAPPQLETIRMFNPSYSAEIVFQTDAPKKQASGILFYVVSKINLPVCELDRLALVLKTVFNELDYEFKLVKIERGICPKKLSI